MFDESFKDSPIKTAYRWFYNCSGLTKVENIGNLTTSTLTDMGDMFRGCKSLTELDVTGFDTSNVTDLGAMFWDCENLKSIDVSGFNTSKAENMAYMFANCKSLTSLDVTNFDTSSVLDMQCMFRECSGLTSLDVTKFNTAKVTNMNQMFAMCTGLESIDVSNFNTSSVTNMGSMFYNCKKFTSLDVSNFDTSKVTDMGAMFSSCSGLTTLDLSNFNTALVTNMGEMFKGDTGLKELNIANFSTASITGEGLKNMMSGVGTWEKEPPCILIYGKDFNGGSIGDVTTQKGDYVAILFEGGDFFAYLFNDQTKDCSELFTKYNGKTVGVMTNRTLKPGTLNTFCMPFDIPRDTLKKLCGSDVVVKKLEQKDSPYAEGKSLDVTFTDYTGNLAAGTPYIIKVTKTVENLRFESVKINTTENPVQFNYTDGSNILGTMTFRGVSFMTDVAEYNDSKNALFFKSGTLYYPHVAAGKPCVIYGMRAFFTINATSSAKPATFNFVMQEAPTGIAKVKAKAADDASAPAYTTGGLRAGSNYKGIVIKGGRKYLQK